MRKTIIIFSFILCALSLSAQEVNIRGSVRDSNGIPIPGAVIAVSGNTSVASVSDAEGRFSLKVDVSKPVSLEAICIGYQKQILPVGDSDMLDFVLAVDAVFLDEAVVVGYGSMRKSDLTGAISAVKLDEDEAAKSTSVDQLITGKAAGVQVLANSAAPDAGVNIRIRGTSTFNGDASPLFVVDGIIINSSSEAVSLFTHGTDAGGSDEQTNGLLGLNPQDIADMQVLKDASATAIYGSQGANGVILITTKSAKSDRPVIRFSTGVDISSPSRKIDMLSFDEYVDYLGMLNAAAPEKVSYNSIMNTLYEDPVNRTGLKVEPVDWQDYSFRTTVSRRHYLSLSAKPDKMMYFITLGYNSKNGVVRNSDFSQYTARVNLDREIGSWLKIGTRSNFSYLKSNLIQGTSTNRLLGSASFMRSILMTRPWKLSDEDDEVLLGPDKWLNDFVSVREAMRVTPSIYAELKILPWLQFKTVLGADYESSELGKFKSINISRTDGNSGAISHSDSFRYNFDNMFLLEHSTGRHHLSGTLAFTASAREQSTNKEEGWNITQYKAKLQSLNSAESALLDYFESRSTLMSVLARAIYNYSDKYILTSSVRYDGSSKFSGKNKWGLFPSFAFAWRVNQEPWFNIRKISHLKLRLGLGQVGNQAISNYQTLTTYDTGSLANHYNQAGYNLALFPGIMANPDLKWETTDQFNAGLDIDFFVGRLAFSMEYYDKKTRDLLQQKYISKSSGYSQVWVNQGAIRNYGAELTMSAAPVVAGKFEWTLDGNISLNRNRILSIGDVGEAGEIFLNDGRKVKTSYFYGSTMSNGGSALNIINIFMEGQPMGLFYGYKTDGIVGKGETGPSFSEGQSYDEGHVKYIDMNRNGYIDDDDRAVIGNPNPDFTYGFSTRFKYGNLSLSASFTGSYGNEIFNLNNDREYYTSQGLYNVRKIAVSSSWTEDNAGARFPAVGKIESADKARFTDVNVEDGSYLRMANLSLTYNVPLKKKKVVRGLSFSASASNLFVLTKYSGWDPDVNSFGSDIKRMGIDSNSYPQARSYSFDIKLTF